MLDYPKTFSLGTIDVEPNSQKSNFYGQDIESFEDLPEFLFIGHLQRHTFQLVVENNVFKKFFGHSSRKWGARWVGDDEEESYLEIIWDSQSGWKIKCYWFGRCLCLIHGMPTKNLQEVLSTCPDFCKAVDANPAELTFTTVQMPEKQPRLISLPSGTARELIIPLSLTKINDACRLWNELHQHSHSLKTNVAARFILLRQSIIVSNPEHQHVLCFLLNEKQAGRMPPLAFPTLIGQQIRYDRPVYCLEVMAGFADIPQLAEHFSELMSDEDGLNPIQIDPMVHSETGTFNLITSENFSVRWIMEKHWLVPEMKFEPDTNIKEWIKGIHEIAEKHFDESFCKINGILMSEPVPQEPKSGSIHVTRSLLEDESAADFNINDHRAFTVLLGSILLNPFGPTLNLLGYYEDESELRVLSLNPTTSTDVIVGSIDQSGEITREDWLSLAQAFEDVSCDLYFITEEIPQEYQRDVLNAAYESGSCQEAQSWALMQAFPDDVYSRFDVQLGNKTLDRNAYPDPQEAREHLIEEGIDEESVFQHFLELQQNWVGCELYFLHGNAQLSWIWARLFLHVKTNVPFNDEPTN